MNVQHTIYAAGPLCGAGPFCSAGPYRRAPMAPMLQSVPESKPEKIVFFPNLHQIFFSTEMLIFFILN